MTDTSSSSSSSIGNHFGGKTRSSKWKKEGKCARVRVPDLRGTFVIYFSRGRNICLCFLFPFASRVFHLFSSFFFTFIHSVTVHIQAVIISFFTLVTGIDYLFSENQSEFTLSQSLSKTAHGFSFPREQHAHFEVSRNNTRRKNRGSFRVLFFSTLRFGNTSTRGKFFSFYDKEAK